MHFTGVAIVELDVEVLAGVLVQRAADWYDSARMEEVVLGTPIGTHPGSHRQVSGLHLDLSDCILKQLLSGVNVRSEPSLVVKKDSIDVRWSDCIEPTRIEMPILLVQYAQPVFEQVCVQCCIFDICFQFPRRLLGKFLRRRFLVKLVLSLQVARFSGKSFLCFRRDGTNWKSDHGVVLNLAQRTFSLCLAQNFWISPWQQSHIVDMNLTLVPVVQFDKDKMFGNGETLDCSRIEEVQLWTP